MIFEGNTTCYDFNNNVDSSNKLYIPMYTSVINIENRVSFGLLTSANFTLINHELSNFTKSTSFERKTEEIRKYGSFTKYIHFPTTNLYFIFTEKNFMYIISQGKDNKFKVNKLLASKEKILDIINDEDNPLIIKNSGIIQQISQSGTPIYKKLISDKLTHGVVYKIIKIVKEVNLSLLLTDFNKLIFIFQQQTYTNTSNSNDSINDIISGGTTNKEELTSIKEVLLFDVLYLNESSTLILLTYTSNGNISIFKHTKDQSEYKDKIINKEENSFTKNKVSQIHIEEEIESINLVRSYSIYYKEPCVLITFKSHSILLNLHFNNIISFNEKVNFVQILPTSFIYPNGTYIIEMKQTKIVHTDFIVSSFSKSKIYNVNLKLSNGFTPLKNTSKFNLNGHSKQLKLCNINSEGFSLLEELGNKKNSFYWDYIEPPITYKSTEKEFYVKDIIETGYESVYIIITSIGLFCYDGFEEKWGSIHIEENKLCFTNTKIYDGLKHIKYLKGNGIVIISKCEDKHFLLVFNVIQFVNKQSNSKIGQTSHSLKLKGNCILSNPPRYVYYDKYLVLNNDYKIIILDFIDNKETTKISKRETIELSSLSINNEINSNINKAKVVKIKKYVNGEYILFILNHNNELFSVVDKKTTFNNNNDNNEVFDLDIKVTKSFEHVSSNVSDFTIYNLHKDGQTKNTNKKYEGYYLFVEKLDGSVSIMLPEALLQITPTDYITNNNSFKELAVVNNKKEIIKRLKRTKNIYKPGKLLKNYTLNNSYFPSGYNPFKIIKVINEIKDFNPHSNAHFTITTIKEVPFMMEFMKAVLDANYYTKSDINDLDNESDLITLIRSYENYSFYLEKLFYIHFNDKEHNLQIRNVSKFIKTHFGSIWYTVIVNLLRKNEPKYTTEILEAFDTTLEKIIKKFEINKESENLSKLCPIVEQTYGLKEALKYTVNVIEGFNMVYEVDINKGNLIEQTINYMFNLRIKICEEKTKIEVSGIDNENNKPIKEDYKEFKSIDENNNHDIIEYLDTRQNNEDHQIQEDEINDYKDGNDELDDIELIEL